MRWRYPFFILILALFFIAVFTIFAHSDEPLRVTTITVNSGDTLWGIARKYGDQDTDPRNTVQVIRELNQLDDPKIYPGQKLKIPQY